MRRCVIACVAAALFASACGGPLDRRDGALIIHLSGAPANADSVEVTLRAGGRMFDARVPFPPDAVLASFTAVPVGKASIDLRLYAGSTAIASRLGLEIDIAEDQTNELTAVFDGGGPQAALDGPQDGALHAIADGPIALEVRADDPLIAVQAALTVNDQPLPMEDRGHGVFAASIDPHLAGAILPAILHIRVELCALGDASACTHLELSITVHRRVWKTDLGSVAKARPAYVAGASQALIVAGDRHGLLHLLHAETGADAFSPLQLAAPLLLAPAIADDLAVIADGEGVVHAVELATGTEAAWSVPLGASATGAVFDGGRVVICAGNRVVAIDHFTGASHELGALPDQILADPLADERGVVAADHSGNVLALDASGRTIFTATVAGSVRAPPVRDASGGVVVATESGSIARFTATGQSAGAAIALEGPVVLRPVLLGETVVAAAGVLIAFVDGGAATTYRLAAPITGAPYVWDERSVAVGLTNGLVAIVARDGSKRFLSRIEGSALSPLVLEGPKRAAVAGSTGDFEMLVAEEGF